MECGVASLLLELGIPKILEASLQGLYRKARVAALSKLFLGETRLSLSRLQKLRGTHLQFILSPRVLSAAPGSRGGENVQTAAEVRVD